MGSKEYEILKRAILNEVEGYEFYRMACQNAGSKEVRDGFMELAAEELEHINWLKELYSKIRDEKANEFSLGLVSEPPSPKIFTWENLDRKNAAIALSVFGIGIQMERNAIDYYKKAAISTEVKEAKELYEKLAKWEETHLEQFSKQYQELTENWWIEQGFSPY